jgi:hypothetical protein
MKVFKAKNYTFNYMIDTDGVSCSILLIRRDLAGRRAPKKKFEVKREQYIDDLREDERQVFKIKAVYTFYFTLV